MKKRVKEEDKTKVLSFFMMGFPTILIVGIAMLTSVTETWWVMVLLAVYQFLLMKQFIDKYYEVL